MERAAGTASRLVSCAWLAARLDDPRVRVIEVSSSADGEAYRQGHVPGAVCWHWKAALWHPTDRQFATPAEMAERLGAIGVSPDTTVVVYGVPVQFGTYAAWALTMCGHQDVRLLDGGRTRWALEGRPLATDVPEFEPVPYPPGHADASSRVGRDEVRARLGSPDLLLLDTRSRGEYLGERLGPSPASDHGAQRAGRIPGAVHLHYRDLLDGDDTFKPPAALRALCEGVGASPGEATAVVTYCRLSHRATVAWFAMRHLLGFANVRVYDGSWTEWGSIVGFPVER